MVLERRMPLREVSERMEVSYRHAKRLKHVVIHGNTGRRPANAIAVELRQKIVALSRTEYASLMTPIPPRSFYVSRKFESVGRRPGRFVGSWHCARETKTSSPPPVLQGSKASTMVEIQAANFLDIAFSPE
jgi:hypothetical protein